MTSNDEKIKKKGEGKKFIYKSGRIMVNAKGK